MGLQSLQEVREGLSRPDAAHHITPGPENVADSVRGAAGCRHWDAQEGIVVALSLQKSHRTAARWWGRGAAENRALRIFEHVKAVLSL